MSAAAVRHAPSRARAPRSPCRRRSPSACRSTRRARTRSRDWSSPPSCSRLRWSCSRARHSGEGRAGGGSAVGHAGFTVSGYQIVGLAHMGRAPVDEVVNDELHRAADEAGTDKAPQALVDAGAIRERLLQFGWVKDARVLRRLPDTLVIDIVERKPAALWQNQGRARADRFRRRRARPGAGRPNARPAAADRPRR